MGRERRERETLIPAFDPEMLAKELEAADLQGGRPTVTPPFDASSYARMLDNHVERDAGDGRGDPRTITAVTPPSPPLPGFPSDSTANEATSSIGRAMYGSYLSSDYPSALVLAERVLEREPDHALAQLVIEGCRERLGNGSDAQRLSPSSVVRLKRPFEIVELVEPDPTSQIVIDHIDGVIDVTMLAELAGIPRPEAMNRLHALLDLGVVEVVSD